MAYYDALTEKWATLAGTTDERLAALNTELVDGPKAAVDISSVTGYLATNLKLAALISYADDPPVGADEASVASAKNLVALFRLPQPPAFRTDLPEVYSVVEAALNTLAADPLSGVTTDDASALMALADTQIPWWQAAGYPEPINGTNLVQAGLV